MLIDAHNHLGAPDIGDGRSQSVQELLDSMDSAGIDKSLVFPFNNPGSDGGFRSANDEIAAAVRAFPERLIGLGRVDPNRGELAVLEAERCFIDYRFAGLKLHPKAQDFKLTDVAVRDLLHVVADLGGIVIFDSGTAAAPWAELSSLAARFSQVNIVGAHMHGEGYLQAAELAPNLFLGTTDVINAARIEEAVRVVGATQLISGSDSPYIDQSTEVQKIRSLDITEAEKALILGGNIERLLGFHS